MSAVAVPSLYANGGGAPVFSAGVPVDMNGATCLRCHRSFELNPPGGALRVEAASYRPGVKQKVKVTVSHPEAQRWGFQLTVRKAGDLTQRAGSFTPTPDIRVLCTDVAPQRNVTAENPCPSASLEFATHNAASSREGANGTKTFEVEWTPPAGEDDVVFFASGNAANGNNINVGDRVYNNGPDGYRVRPLSRACTNTARPLITGIVNAASGERQVSPGSLISIFGRDFGPADTRHIAGAADLAGGKFPQELACLAVEAGGQRIPLTYAGAGQINAQLPIGLGTGTQTVRVIANPGAANPLISEPSQINVSAHAPAFFTFNRTSVAAVHPDGTLAASPSVVAQGRPVAPGEAVQLFATGLGPTEPVWQAGEMPERASPVRDRISVTVGGTVLPAADILYAGAVPGSISGLYQINIRIPASAANGDVPVIVSAGGVSSPPGTTIPVMRR